jgi:NitT/TauT family transport system substrate-binding protein
MVEGRGGDRDAAVSETEARWQEEAVIRNFACRAFAPTVVAVIGCIAIAATAAAGTPLRVGKAASNASPIIPVNVGDKLGIFAKHGLDLKISDFTGGSKLSQAMSAGSIDIGVGAGTEMALITKGAPMRAICNAAPSIPFIGIAVPWDSPIKTVDALKGKKIGVSSAGSLTNWLALELARQRGWGLQGVTPVAIGNAAASVLAAFKEQQIDADIAVTSLIFSMEEKHVGRLLIPVSDYAGNLAAGAIFATGQLIDSNPDAVRAFLAGWLETIDFIRHHKQRTVELESGITGFSASVMAKEYDLTIGMFSSDCKFDAQSLATLERSFTDLRLVANPPDMSKLYTEAFLPK